MSNQNALTISDRVKTVSWRFRDVSTAYPAIKKKKNVKITTPEIFYNTFKFLFYRKVKEMFVVFWLSSNNKVIGFEVVSEGTLNSSVVHPREVFRGAIVSSCASIILAHNHPSGNPEPSGEDIKITNSLVDTGKTIDIRVFDHIIFADSGYSSFVENSICNFV